MQLISIAVALMSRTGATVTVTMLFMRCRHPAAFRLLEEAGAGQQVAFPLRTLVAQMDSSRTQAACRNAKQHVKRFRNAVLGVRVHVAISRTELT